MRRGFDRFYDSIGRLGTRLKRRSDRFYGLVMGTIHHECSSGDHLVQETRRYHGYRMRDMDSLRFLTMIQCTRDL